MTASDTPAEVNEPQHAAENAEIGATVAALTAAGLDGDTVPETLCTTLSAQVAPDGRTLFGEALDPHGRQVSWIARLN